MSSTPDAVLEESLRFPLGAFESTGKQIDVKDELIDMFSPDCWRSGDPVTTSPGARVRVAFTDFVNAAKNAIKNNNVAVTALKTKRLSNASSSVTDVVASTEAFVLEVSVAVAIANAVTPPPAATLIAVKDKLLATNYTDDWSKIKDAPSASLTELNNFSGKPAFVSVLYPFLAIKYIDAVYTNQSEYIFIQRLATLAKLYIGLRVSDAIDNAVFKKDLLTWIYGNTLTLEIIDGTPSNGLDDMFADNVETSQNIKDNAAILSKARKRLADARDNWDTMAVGNEDSYAFRKRALWFFYAAVALLCVQIVGLVAAGYYGNGTAHIVVASVFIVVPMAMEAYDNMRGVFSIADSTSLSNWAPPV